MSNVFISNRNIKQVRWQNVTFFLIGTVLKFLRWLTLHLLLFKSCVVLFTALLAVLLREHTTDASLLGLALTCASTVRFY